MKKIKYLLILLFILILPSCNTKNYDGEVNILNWSSYIPYEIINDFQKEYNIKVNY